MECGGGNSNFLFKALGKMELIVKAQLFRNERDRVIGL